MQIEDNLLAILTRLRDRRAAIRRILKRIASLDEPARQSALAKFLVISHLRRLVVPAIEEEAQKMPILGDIMDHELFGPAIRKGIKQGRKEGLRDGMQAGMQAGRQEILTQQLQKRFGAIPKRIKTRLANLSVSELDEAALRLLDAASLDELFPRKSQ